ETTGIGNLLNVNPALGPLADNGGRTQTHALLPGSPAIDAGDPAAVAGVGGVPSFDERTAPYTRIFGGRIDMGAVEVEAAGFLAGDYNGNGVVDAADYTQWRDTNGSNVAAATGADGNGDGKVDSLDYNVWKTNFGQTLPVILGSGSGAAAASSAGDTPAA